MPEGYITDEEMIRQRLAEKGLLGGHKIDGLCLMQEAGDALTATHYQLDGQQPIETMQRAMPPQQFIGYLRGNVSKYALRMGHKDAELKDAKKAAQYAYWLVLALGGRTIDPRKDVLP